LCDSKNASTPQAKRPGTSLQLQYIKRAFRPQGRRRLLVIVGLALLALLDLSRAVSPSGVVRPLIGRDGWEKTTGFFNDRLPITPLEAPEGIIRSADLVTWRSWSSQTEGTVGEIGTVPFLLPDYMAVPYTGFPGETPGNRIVLRCEADGVRACAPTPSGRPHFYAQVASVLDQPA